MDIQKIANIYQLFCKTKHLFSCLKLQSLEHAEGKYSCRTYRGCINIMKQFTFIPFSLF